MFFESLSINDTKFCISVFKEMDTNHDLYLSREGVCVFKNYTLCFLIIFIYYNLEFIDAGLDFFMGVDNTSPSKYFFGPLVDI